MRFSDYFIVTDLDGTLFNRVQKVPENSISALEYFKKNGGTFTFATGRDVMFIKRRFPFLIDLINAPAIMTNGAHIFDFKSDKTLLNFSLNQYDAVRILTSVNTRFPDAPFEISSSSGYKVINPDEHFVKRFNNMTDLVTFSNELIIPDDDILRVNFIDRNLDRLNAVSQYIQALDENNCFEKVFSDTFIYELLPKSATKGNALNHVRSIIGNNKTVIAAGDWYNDMSILMASDVPVCPSNSASEIKDFCKYTLCHCDNGVLSDIVSLIEQGLI